MVGRRRLAAGAFAWTTGVLDLARLRRSSIAAEAPSASAPAKAPPSGVHGEPLGRALETHAVEVAASRAPSHAIALPSAVAAPRCSSKQRLGVWLRSASAPASARAVVRTSAGTHAATGSLAD